MMNYSLVFLYIFTGTKTSVNNIITWYVSVILRIINGPIWSAISSLTNPVSLSNILLKIWDKILILVYHLQLLGPIYYQGLKHTWLMQLCHF